MQRNFFPWAADRISSGAFHDYIRGVFADRSNDANRLRDARARWLRELGGRAATSPAEQRWGGEGGSGSKTPVSPARAGEEPDPQRRTRPEAAEYDPQECGP